MKFHHFHSRIDHLNLPSFSNGILHWKTGHLQSVSNKSLKFLPANCHPNLIYSMLSKDILRNYQLFILSYLVIFIDDSMSFDRDAQRLLLIYDKYHELHSRTHVISVNSFKAYEKVWTLFNKHCSHVNYLSISRLSISSYIISSHFNNLFSFTTKNIQKYVDNCNLNSSVQCTSQSQITEHENLSVSVCKNLYHKIVKKFC